LIILYIITDFSNIGDDFKTIDNKNFRELFNVNNKHLSMQTLGYLGLIQEIISPLVNFVNVLIKSIDDESKPLSNQLFEFIDRFIASKVVEIKDVSPGDTTKIKFQKALLADGGARACPGGIIVG